MGGGSLGRGKPAPSMPHPTHPPTHPRTRPPQRAGPPLAALQRGRPQLELVRLGQVRRRRLQPLEVRPVPDLRLRVAPEHLWVGWGRSWGDNGDRGWVTAAVKHQQRSNNEQKCRTCLLGLGEGHPRALLLFVTEREEAGEEHPVLVGGRAWQAWHGGEM